jgi:hypothetical protein
MAGYQHNLRNERGELILNSVFVPVHVNLTTRRLCDGNDRIGKPANTPKKDTTQ